MKITSATWPVGHFIRRVWCVLFHKRHWSYDCAAGWPTIDSTGDYYERWCLICNRRWRQPISDDSIPWGEYERSVRRHRLPNAEAHGRRSRTVQPLVGSLDGDK